MKTTGTAAILLSASAAVALAQEEECHTYNKGDIGMELCLNTETSTAVDGKEMSTISGSLLNTGMANMCNITFDILNLDEAEELQPTYLPRVPDAFKPSDKIEFHAKVPVDEESHVEPYADIWSTFYECSEAEMNALAAKVEVVEREEIQLDQGEVMRAEDSFELEELEEVQAVVEVPVVEEETPVVEEETPVVEVEVEVEEETPVVEVEEEASVVEVEEEAPVVEVEEETPVVIEEVEANRREKPFNPEEPVEKKPTVEPVVEETPSVNKERDAITNKEQPRDTNKEQPVVVVVEEEEEAESTTSTTIESPSGESMDFEELITPETACFMGCYAGIVELNNGSEENIPACPSLEYIFSNDCHNCDFMVVEASREKCIEFGCSETECATMDTVKTSSAPPSTMNINSIAIITTSLTAIATAWFYAL